MPVPSSIKKKKEVSQNNINDIYMGVFVHGKKFYTHISNPEILCVMDTSSAALDAFSF